MLSGHAVMTTDGLPMLDGFGHSRTAISEVKDSQTKLQVITSLETVERACADFQQIINRGAGLNEDHAM
jgi:hypothetical protein